MVNPLGGHEKTQATRCDAETAAQQVRLIELIQSIQRIRKLIEGFTQLVNYEFH